MNDVSRSRLFAATVPALLRAASHRDDRAARVGEVLDVNLGDTRVGSALRELGVTVSSHEDSGDALVLEYPDGAFADTTANFVLDHVDDPQAAAAELLRVTRSDGRVLATMEAGQDRVGSLADTFYRAGAVSVAVHTIPESPSEGIPAAVLAVATPPLLGLDLLMGDVS
jgi:SAM-dependent methyltransferase